MGSADEEFMREALVEAAAASDAGEVPIGAIVVIDGEVKGRGTTRSLKRKTRRRTPRLSPCARRPAPSAITD